MQKTGSIPHTSAKNELFMLTFRKVEILCYCYEQMAREENTTIKIL